MIEVEINDKLYHLRNKLSDISVKLYSDIYENLEKIQNIQADSEYDEDVEKIKNIIKNKYEIVKKLAVENDFKNIVDEISIYKINEIINSLELDYDKDINRNVITIDNNRYGFNLMTDPILDEFIDCEFYAKNKKFSELINLMYRPILNYKDDIHYSITKYDCNNINDISDKITADYLLHCISFFLSIQIVYQKNMVKKRSLKKRLKMLGYRLKYRLLTIL
jgi:hypothetical protein